MIRQSCWFCDHTWGACTCTKLLGFVFPEDLPEDATVATFDGFDDETHEFFITAPNVSECGRFFVDPVAYYGAPFEAWWIARRAREVLS